MLYIKRDRREHLTYICFIKRERTWFFFFSFFSLLVNTLWNGHYYPYFISKETEDHKRLSNLPTVIQLLCHQANALRLQIWVLHHMFTCERASISRKKKNNKLSRSIFVFKICLPNFVWKIKNNGMETFYET